MKNILVPVGASHNAVSNLQYAIDLASFLGDVNVYIISIFKEFSKAGTGTRLNRIMEEDSISNLQKVIDAVDKKGVTVVAHPIKGDVVDGVNRFNKHIPVDLMILSPRSNSLKEEVFLGNSSGKLVKQTDIPVLVVPEDYKFKPAEKILMAFKDGQVSKKRVLKPLRSLLAAFEADLNLLKVITPDSENKEPKLHETLDKLKSSIKTTENLTTFQGVLEHFQSNNPDMLCVIRRKRGFFQKLWEKNIILKKEFYCSIPLLVLSGK